VTDVTKRSSMDRSISGIKTMLREDPQEALQLADRIIKNTYRTLLTRGMKGCYVYCCDQALRDHFAAQLSPARPQTSAGSVETAHLQNSAGSGDTARPQAPALFREPEVLPGPRIEPR
jgi:hypothetical protein